MANRKRRVQNRRKKQAEQQRYIVAGMAAAAILIAAVLIYSQLPAGAELPDEVDTKYDGLTQTVTAEGFVMLGDPEAPVLVREYSSFTCSHCKNLAAVIDNSILSMVRDGDVRIIFVPIDRGAPNERDMVRATLCAADQGMFWEMHDVMFEWQGKVSFSERRLKAAAEELGMEDVDGYMDCADSTEKDALIVQGREDFTARGFTGTPGVVVNNQPVNWTQLRSIIEEELRSE